MWQDNDDDENEDYDEEITEDDVLWVMGGLYALQELGITLPPVNHGITMKGVAEWDQLDSNAYISDWAIKTVLIEVVDDMFEVAKLYYLLEAFRDDREALEEEIERVNTPVELPPTKRTWLEWLQEAMSLVRSV